MSAASFVWGEAVEAAEDLLRNVYHLDVRKALDPTKRLDLLIIEQRLAAALHGVAKKDEAAAMTKALEVLDVDWPNMSSAQVAKVVEAARATIANIPKAKTAQYKAQLAASGKEIITATKMVTERRFDLGIDTSFDKTDETIAAHAATAQAHYITNSYGKRSHVFSHVARDIVSKGVADGLDRYEIGKELHGALGNAVGRSESYFRMVAGVHIVRSRSYASLASYSSAGVERYRFEAVLDEVTSLQCRLMHGRSFSVASSLAKHHEVASSEDPEDVKFIQPWMQTGKYPNGNQYLYTRSKEGARTHIADVQENAMGQVDNAGTFKVGAGVDLEKKGVTMPPLHGNCRSTVVPDGLDISSAPGAVSMPPPPARAEGQPLGMQPLSPTQLPAGAPGLGGLFPTDEELAPPEPEPGAPPVAEWQKVVYAGIDDAGDAGGEPGKMFGPWMHPPSKEDEPGVPDVGFDLPKAGRIADARKKPPIPVDAGWDQLTMAGKNKVDKKKVLALVASADKDGNIPGVKPVVAVGPDGGEYIVAGHEHAIAQALMSEAKGDKPPKIQAHYMAKLPASKPVKPKPAMVAPPPEQVPHVEPVPVPPPVVVARPPPPRAQPVVSPDLGNPKKTVVWTANTPMHEGEALNGVPLTAAKEGAWLAANGHKEKDFGEPPIPSTPGKQPASGVMIIEPDGRVWIVEPRGNYGGAKNTWPKGKIDNDGLTAQQNAIKEAFEESGLDVELTGYIGDFAGSTSMTRYYVARRKGGAPWAPKHETSIGGTESSAVKLMTQDEALNGGHFSFNRDKQVLRTYQENLKKLKLEDVKATKVGAQAGSNTGGLYVGKDGVKRYVKEYADPAQAPSEHLANQLYRDLGLGAPTSHVFMKDGKPLAYASDIIDGDTLATLGLTEERAKKVMDGFGADVLMSNWDAIGLSKDNMLLDKSGNVFRIDNGGALLLRAQGGKKNQTDLDQLNELKSFFNKDINRNYSEVAAKAGIRKVDDMHLQFKAQVKAIAELRDQHGGWQKYVDVHDKGLSPADKARIVAMLEKRTDLMRQAVKDMDKAAGILAPPEKLSDLDKKKPPTHDDVVKLLGRSIDRHEQKDTIYEYATAADVTGVKQFTGSHYGIIRDAQNGRTKSLSGYAHDSGSLASAARWGEQCEQLMRKVPPQAPGAVVYRGIHGKSPKEIADILSRDVMVLGGTTSSSRTWKVACQSNFGNYDGARADSQSVLFHIKQYSATGIEAISSVGYENELLLSKTSKYKVVGQYQDPSNPYVLHLELEEIEGPHFETHGPGLNGKPVPSTAPPAPTKPKKPRAKKPKVAA